MLTWSSWWNLNLLDKLPHLSQSTVPPVLVASQQCKAPTMLLSQLMKEISLSFNHSNISALVHWLWNQGVIIITVQCLTGNQANNIYNLFLWQSMFIGNQSHFFLLIIKRRPGWSAQSKPSWLSDIQWDAVYLSLAAPKPCQCYGFHGTMRMLPGKSLTNLRKCNTLNQKTHQVWIPYGKHMDVGKA